MAMTGKGAFGQFVATKRRGTGLTQKELASRLHVTESAVSKWERGVSYPDISMVTSLCEALGVTEHELLAASEDYQTHVTEREALTYRRWRGAVLWTFLIGYATALLTCFIVNLAVDHTLSWFFIVLAAVVTAFCLTTLPLLLTERRAWATLAAFTLALVGLIAVCWAQTGGGDWLVVTVVALLFGLLVVFLPVVLAAAHLPEPWNRHRTLACFAADTAALFILLFVAVGLHGSFADFRQITLPFALFGLVGAWALMLVIRYLPLNAWFKVAVCAVIVGAYQLIGGPVGAHIVDDEPFAWPVPHLNTWTDATINDNVTWIIVAACASAALVFALVGASALIRRDADHAATA
jgi:transcriptional regulator with XRE-family HTH domain